jgi:hypothetical protein
MHRVERRGDDGEGGPQLMGGIGGELALHLETLFETIQRAIHR